MALQMFNGPSDPESSFRLHKWLVKDESHVQEGEPIAEIQTDKAIVEVTAETSGPIFQIVQENEVFLAREPIASIGEKMGKLASDPTQNSRFSEMAQSLGAADQNFPFKLVTKRDLVKSFSGKQAEANFLRQSKAVPASMSITLDARIKKFAEESALLKGLLLPFWVWAFAESISIVQERPKMMSVTVERGHYTSLVAVSTISALESLDHLRDRIKKLKRDKVQSSWVQPQIFTISDLSNFKIDSFTPVLGGEQLATLGIASNRDGGYNLTLAYDHSRWTGVEAAKVLEHFSDLVNGLSSVKELEKILSGNS